MMHAPADEIDLDGRTLAKCEKCGELMLVLSGAPHPLCLRCLTPKRDEPPVKREFSYHCKGWREKRDGEWIVHKCGILCGGNEGVANPCVDERARVRKKQCAACYIDDLTARGYEICLRCGRIKNKRTKLCTHCNNIELKYQRARRMRERMERNLK